MTNPAEWDESGLLKLRRRVDPAGVQHKCAVGCSPNMCKGTPRISRSPFLMAQATSGEELEAFLERHQPNFDQIIYVGDGKNDYCPVLRLRRHVRWILIDFIYSRTCFLAKIQFSADVSKGWRVESKKKVPGMVSNVKFTSGPKLGRLRNTLILCGPRSGRLSVTDVEYRGLFWFLTCRRASTGYGARSLILSEQTVFDNTAPIGKR